MSKVSTNISLDADLKKAGQELYADLGMDLSTAVTIFIKQSLRVQGLPFAVTRDNPNAETAAAMNEYYELKAHTEKYPPYSSYSEAMAEVLSDA
ncbi:MAG: type II toxin-antitoxin system RelB/DinJ family antitoxin [Oscillospiraceae bacterium]|nr:type II toxin-antitoxin system RelB/DinJ family antitoxin [Oscillospiraceae bacterium]